MCIMNVSVRGIDGEVFRHLAPMSQGVTEMDRHGQDGMYGRDDERGPYQRDPWPGASHVQSHVPAGGPPAPAPDEQDGFPVEPVGLLEEVSDLAARLQAVRPHLWRIGSDDLAPVVGELGVLVRAAEAAMAGATAEAHSRGVVHESQAASTSAWVREHAGVSEPGRAHAIAQVAEATCEPGTEPLADAVWGQGVSVGAARTMLKESEKVLPLLPGADRADVLGHYLQYAESLSGMGQKASNRTLRQLTRQIQARYGEHALDEIDDRAKECSSLTELSLPTGLVRFQVDLNQPDAARFRAAVDGLAAPRPEQDENGQPVRDTRTPGRRRADALMELITRAQAADQDKTAGGCGLSGSTTLIVTMDHQTLVDWLNGGDCAAGQGRSGLDRSAGDAFTHPAARGARRIGWGRGLPGPAEDAGPTSFATTVNGEVLTPAQVRQAACDAQIVPMLLGTDSAPLDVGMADRFATGHQRAALAQRDGGCTFRGCGRPPSWCHAHHIRHWADGGPTDLGNLVLLCARHHTIVHRDDLVATRIDGRWVWHPQGVGPGRPALPAPGDGEGVDVDVDVDGDADAGGHAGGDGEAGDGRPTGQGPPGIDGGGEPP